MAVDNLIRPDGRGLTILGKTAKTGGDFGFLTF